MKSVRPSSAAGRAQRPQIPGTGSVFVDFIIQRADASSRTDQPERRTGSARRVDAGRRPSALRQETQRQTVQVV